MTVKEVCKLICILIGHENAVIESEITDTIGDRYYTIKDDDFFVDGYGVVDILYNLINEVKKSKHNAPYWMADLGLKYLLDDEYRQTQYKLRNIFDDFLQKQEEILKPHWDYVRQTDPCPNCELNDHSHWDDVHYNCKLCHTHTCKKLLEHESKGSESIKKYMNSPEYKKIIDDYNQQFGIYTSKLDEIYKRINKK